jgi:uncharacterized repeat protein (TIGR02543 family)
MKVTFKFLGIIAIVAITGFSMVACKEPETTYTVTFNSNGGGAVAPITVTSGGMIYRPHNPERDNDFFNGWYRDDSAFKDKWNFNTDIVTGNTTLYADWLSYSGINDADFGSGASIDGIFNVATTAEWDAAVSTISNGDNGKNYIINIMNNFSIAGVNRTFGSYYRLGAISIRGDGMTLSLSGNGRILSIGNQTVILRNVNLQGHSTNDNSLVSVNVGKIIMNGGKISGNTNTSTVFDNGGGGVYIYSGTFTMNNGEISGNTAMRGGGVYIAGSNGTFTVNNGKISGNTATHGGGVHIVIYGTFTMNNGEISGNTSSNGGGACVDGGTFAMNGGEFSGNVGSGVYAFYGTFRISNGTIYGSNAAWNLKNNGALKKDNDATAERGYGSPWVKTGDLSTTDNTIRIVGGALW